MKNALLAAEVEVSWQNVVYVHARPDDLRDSPIELPILRYGNRQYPQRLISVFRKVRKYFAQTFKSSGNTAYPFGGG